MVVAPKRIPDARAEALLTDYRTIHRVVSPTGRETNQDPEAHEVTAIGWWRGRELSR